MSTSAPIPVIRRRVACAVAALLLCATAAAGIAARVAANRTRESSPAADPPPAVVAGRGRPVALSAGLDRGSVLAGGDGLVRMELVLSGERQSASLGPPAIPSDLVVVLDRSGSMQGEPLRYAKAAVRELIAQLGPEDRFALVSYASGASLVVPLEHATSDARAHWESAVAHIPAQGGTDMASGLDRAHRIAVDSDRVGRSTRVVLLSDGHANQGDHSIEGLRARAGRAVGAEYVLSAIGIGQGFDESVMSAVADAGTGNFYYLPDVRELAGIFSDEFAAARGTVASALAVEIRPAEGVHVESAAGYPLAREGGRVRFHPGDLFAGQNRRIWVTLRVPTSTPGDFALGAARVSFADGSGEKREIAIEALPSVACVETERDYYTSIVPDLYRRGMMSEAVGALKQSVAQKLKDGRHAEALADVEEYLQELNVEQELQTRALGHDLGVAPAAEEVEALRGSIRARAAPPARAELGKRLLEEGRDARRPGAKRP